MSTSSRHDGHPPARRRDRRRADRLPRRCGSRRRRAPRRSCSPTCSANKLELPVFLYGELAGGRTRAELRRGGLPGLAERIESGEQVPTSGRAGCTRTAGAVLVATRPPLVAFNVELEPPATLEDARAIAALIREGGAEGLPALRAIGLWLDHRSVAQVSTNVEDHRTHVAGRGRRGDRPSRHAGAGRAGRAGPRGGVRRLPCRPPSRQSPVNRGSSRAPATPRAH